MIATALALAAASNPGAVAAPISFTVPTPNVGGGGVLAGIAAALAAISGGVYVLNRKINSDRRDDKAGDIQQSVFTQMIASIDSLKSMVETERAQNKALGQQQNELLAEMTKQRREWDEERRKLVEDRDAAERRAGALHSEVERLTIAQRAIGDRLMLENPGKSDL